MVRKEYLYGINIGMKLGLIKYLQVQHSFTFNLVLTLLLTQELKDGFPYLMIAIGKLLRAK